VATEAGAYATKATKSDSTTAAAVIVVLGFLIWKTYHCLV
jgi:hypothetical protein